MRKIDPRVGLVIKLLQGAYGKEFSDESIDTYSEMLSDIPPKLLKEAVVRLIKTQKWRPTIAEIRETAVELECDFPDVEDAYQEARRWARSLSPYVQTNVTYSHALVKDAVKMIGGLHVMANSDDPARIAAQFQQAYQQLRAREVRRQQEGRVMTLSEFIGR